MDEKAFEERLSKLSVAYKELPAQTAAEDITRNVFQAEGKKQRFRFFSLPVAASFAGVMLIGGLLSFQILTNEAGPSPGGTNPGMTAQSPPSKEEVKKQTEEARTDYNERLKPLKNKLGTEDADLYPFVQEVSLDIEEFAAKPFKSEKELANQSSRLMNKITSHVSSFEDQMAALEKKAKNGEEIPDEELLLLLSKQDQLQERYMEKWDEIRDSIKFNSESFERDIQSLNDKTYKGYEAETEEIRNQGFRFVHEGEGQVGIVPDYLLIEEKLGESLSSQGSEWLSLFINKRYVFDGEVKDFGALGKRLIELEEFVLTYPNFGKIEKVKEEYSFLLKMYIASGFYTQGGEGELNEQFEESMTKIKEENPTSATHKAILEYHALFETGELAKGQGEEGIQPEIPPFLEEHKPKGTMPFSIFPLTDELKGMYEKLKDTKDIRSLGTVPAYKGMFMNEPKAFLRIYLYAMQEKDYETAYLLTDQQLSIGEFKQKAEQSSDDYLDLSNKVRNVKEDYQDSQDPSVIIELYSERENVSSFTVQNDGTPLSSRVLVK
ncbi:hypothetical protein [Metabacillus sp. 84]|uniref:hypothetical protein n=1 Tax=Metabacillus sp. 84 TaxID=3404705 RepID=UPI003CF157A4